MQVPNALRLLAVLVMFGLAGTGCGGREDEGGGGGSGASAPGVTDTSIKVGTTFALSGPASAYATISKAQQAYFKMVNAKGGVNGRKIEYTVLDDGYEPPRAVNNVRRLVTQDKVFAVFSTLGTPTGLAIWDYLNQQKVPMAFTASGALEWGADLEEHPWTIGWQPDYQTEGIAAGRYLSQEKPDAKVAILFQNDDFGKGYIDGFTKGIEGSGIKIVARESYEVTDPSTAPQVGKLARSGADVFVDIATPKPAAQAIATVAQSDWKPLHIMSNVSASKKLVFTPVGLKAAEGILATNYIKDPESPKWESDAGMQEFKTGLKEQDPSLDVNEPFNAFGWATAETFVKALEKTGKDLTREGFMDTMRNMNEEIGLLLPGIKLVTSDSDGYPIQAVQMQRFNGDNWEEVGETIDTSDDAA
jgi:branched-chain amino acid transport system substrate-binding protein